MSLKDISYQEDYRSNEDNVLRDFFQVSLAEAQTYWRAVGYFSSTALEAFGAPLANFIERGGSIRLITSVELSQADYQAIQDGMSKKEVCVQRISQIITEELIENMGDGIAMLGTLLKIGRLEIKIAVPKHKTGIYHEKVGVFFDDTDDFVAFSGSTNESRNALEENIECIDAYPSWISPTRAQRKRQHFENLWERQAKGVLVFTFPEAAARALIQISEQHGRPKQPTPAENKWRHQDEALEAFLRAERGVLDMATGTGKTRTSLKIVDTLFKHDLIDTVIVCTNGTDLLNQWYGQILGIRNQGDKKLRVYRHYSGNRDSQDFTLDPKNAILLTSRQFAHLSLQNLSHKNAERTLLIHDEVHGLGSPGNRRDLSGLSDHIRFRLGLSATPEREYDTEGNQFIEEHIGPVIFTFGLAEAIERNILAPFNYHPLEYVVTEEDKAKIQAVFARQAAAEKAGNPILDKDIWMQIASVYKLSQAKLPIFTDFIAERPELLNRCIVFVAQQDYGEEVLEIIHRQHPHFHTYFSGEDSETLYRFARGDLECLITCHRLSEGIDIRSLQNVILLSSDRARLETIQRIGRCLRTDPEDPVKVANIVDFIRLNESPDDVPNADELRRDWLMELSQIRPLE